MVNVIVWTKNHDEGNEHWHKYVLDISWNLWLLKWRSVCLRVLCGASDVWIIVVTWLWCRLQGMVVRELVKCRQVLMTQGETHATSQIWISREIIAPDQSVKSLSATTQATGYHHCLITNYASALWVGIWKSLWVQSQFYCTFLWLLYGIGQAIIVLPCGFYLSFFLLLFSSPNLSGHRLDVYHTSKRGGLRI